MFGFLVFVKQKQEWASQGCPLKKYGGEQDYRKPHRILSLGCCKHPKAELKSIT
jgi:hypothetical protein